MNFLERLIGRNPQIDEQPIILPPLQANPNLGSNGLPIQQPKLKNLMLNNNGQMLPQAETNQFFANENNVNTPVVEMGLKRQPEQRGLLQDVASGYQDNFNNPISAVNFRPDPSKNGANKFGEALGTFGRVMNSPGGRGLATALAVGAMGGNPTQAMTYGLQAGVGNYNNVNQDRMNRELLKQQGIDTSNVRGYLNNDTAKAYTDNYYKLNNAQYRNRKLDQDSYIKIKKLYDDQLRNGIIDPATYETQVKTLNEKYLDDQIVTVGANNTKKSNQTRNTDINEDLAPAKKYAYYTAPRVALGNLGLNQMKADPGYQATVEGAKENAKKQADNYNKDVETYNTYTSKIPELKAQVANLNKLAKIASYTKVQVAGDSITRQLGLPVSKGAVARTEYTATINNQILPLLRETFGAQFTEREGEALRSSLGDVTKSPAEKQAVLNAFIKQKEMNIQSQARKVQQYGGGVPRPPSQGGIAKGTVQRNKTTGAIRVWDGVKWQNK